MNESITEFFERTTVLADLEADELGEAMRAISLIQLPAGRALFAPGDEADAMYLVHSGRIDISRPSTKGGEIRIATLGVGEMIGEMALLGGGTRSTEARAVEASSLLRVDRHEFAFLQRSGKLAAYKMLSAMSRGLCVRIRDANGRLKKKGAGRRSVISGIFGRKSWLDQLISRKDKS